MSDSNINDTFGGSLTSEYGDNSSSKLEPEAILGGKYRLEKRAGRGGMGEIWKAFDTIGERDVALKFVPRDVQHFENEVRRVKETFKTVHELNHQNICPVYAMENDPVHGFYLVMKWLDGRTLEEFCNRKLKKGNRLPFQYVPVLLESVAEALDYAHKQKVIHRDVKPSNIFFKIEQGKIKEVYLIDFGLATEIRESMSRVSQVQFNTSGTRSYMSPEQWQARKQDAKADQYSLAVVAYELYAGYLPFTGSDMEILGLSVINDPPERIEGIPDSVNDALLKALSKNRDERYDTCSDFIHALPRNLENAQNAKQNNEHSELSHNSAESRKDWLNRISGYEEVEIGCGEFDLEKSNPARGLFIAAMTWNPHCTGKTRFADRTEMKVQIPAHEVDEICNKKPKIQVTGKIQVQDDDWTLTNIQLHYRLKESRKGPSTPVLLGDLIAQEQRISEASKTAGDIGINKNDKIYNIASEPKDQDVSDNSNPFVLAPEAKITTKFCTNCGKSVDENAFACMGCGARPTGHHKFCRHCGVALNPEQIVCIQCGQKCTKYSHSVSFMFKNVCRCLSSLFSHNNAPSDNGPLQTSPYGSACKKQQSTAGVLAIFLGCVGIHKYYLGSWGWGIIFTIAGLTTNGILTGIIGLVEGMIILTMSREAFNAKYSNDTQSPFRW